MNAAIATTAKRAYGTVMPIVRNLWLWRVGRIGCSPFVSVQIRCIGIYTKTPMGWRRSRHFEDECFIPNPTIQRAETRKEQA